MTLGAALFLYFFGAGMAEDIQTIFIEGLSFDRSHAYDVHMLTNRILALVEQAIFMVLPFLMLMVLIALVSGSLLGGWNFSLQAMSPKISKLNPLSGLKRMVSMTALMELLKALGKFVLVSVVATYFLWYSYEEILSIGVEPTKMALAHSAKLIWKRLFS